MIARFVPLDLRDFPGARKSDGRRRSQFKAGWAKTLELLDYELMALGATDVIVQAGFRPADIRMDGWPLGRATPSHPAVIVSLRDGENRPLSFPCDRYDQYADNLRAIALSLEALRAVDRHGVTKRGEQYQGFKALEAPRPWTIEDSAAFVSIKSGTPATVIMHDAASWKTAYRVAASTLHPDAGGNPHEWELLNKAKEMLNLHHGTAKMDQVQ
jgi:hypothetical protein